MNFNILTYANGDFKVMKERKLNEEAGISDLLRKKQKELDRSLTLMFESGGSSTITDFWTDENIESFNTEEELYQYLISDAQQMDFRSILNRYEEYGFLETDDIEWMINVITQMQHTLVKIRENLVTGVLLKQDIERIDEELDRL